MSVRAQTNLETSNWSKKDTSFGGVIGFTLISSFVSSFVRPAQLVISIIVKTKNIFFGHQLLIIINRVMQLYSDDIRNVGVNCDSLGHSKNWEDMSFNFHEIFSLGLQTLTTSSNILMKEVTFSLLLISI